MSFQYPNFLTRQLTRNISSTKLPLLLSLQHADTSIGSLADTNQAEVPRQTDSHVRLPRSNKPDSPENHIQHKNASYLDPADGATLFSQNSSYFSNTVASAEIRRHVRTV